MRGISWNMSFKLEVPFQCHLLVPLISFDKPNGSLQNNNDDKKGLAHSTPLVLLCSLNDALQVQKLPNVLQPRSKIGCSICRQVKSLKSDVLVILPSVKPSWSRIPMIDGKTDPQSMLFLHASPHICSQWHGTELCFALLWLLISGISSKWSPVICVEELLQQWKEQDVMVYPEVQKTQNHTHRL